MFKRIFTFLILFVYAGSILSQESTERKPLTVKAKVLYDKQSHPNLTLYVNVFQDGKHFKTSWCDPEGKFEAEIFPGHVYLFEFSAHYYYTSRVEIKTNIPKEKIASEVGKILDVDVEMYNLQKTLDPSYFEKPLLNISYLSGVGEFTHDYTHTEKLKKLLVYFGDEYSISQLKSSRKSKEVDKVVVLLNKIELKEQEIEKLQNEKRKSITENVALNEEIVILNGELTGLNDLLLMCDTSDQVVLIETMQEINDLGGIHSARENLELLKLNARTAEDSALIAFKERELNMIEEELMAANASLIQKELDIQAKELEVKTQKQRLIYAGIGISSILTLAIFLFISFRKTKKANKLISNQKAEIENRNLEIRKSITYARRIQEAILPSYKLVRAFLKNSFILYKPKDIVAGDFYWFESKGDDVYFAAADCTGHGVPGAMVSVVCANVLNRTVNELKISDPAEILNKVRDLVVETFEKSDHEVNDGMDISFCKLNMKSRKLWYSGAHNPLYRITKLNGEADERTIKNKTHMLLEYKGDKQPIGKFDFQRPFTQREIQLLEGDSIYIFSDGFPDQFGGPEGRKYMYKRFKNLLLSNHELNPEQQNQKLVEEFENWSGSEEQIDDVCIIGVKI